MTPVETMRCQADELETARQIASMFLPGAASLSLRRVGGGLSGAAVFALQTGDKTYALKRWPAGTSAARVDEVHEVMLRSRRAFDLVPELVRSPLGSTRLGWDSCHYELASWMPGEPFASGKQQCFGFGGAADFPGLSSTLSAVRWGAQAIASFHDSVRQWGSVCSPAPAVLRRLGRIEQLRSELPAALAACDGLSPPLSGAADWLRRHGICGLDTACATLGRWAGQMVPTQIVLRDVHREHILFNAGRATGLVDFDAVGRDTPSGDLARWVSGFLQPGVDAAAIWEAAAAGYRCVREISACELELASAINEASGVVLVANWVVWTALKQRDFSSCYDLVDRRVSELMRRMVADRIVTDPHW